MKYRVGQKVEALHDISWPTAIGPLPIASKGEVGEIVGVGIDAQFGMVTVNFKGGWTPLFVAPHPNAAVRLVES